MLCSLHGPFLPSEEEWDFLWCDVSWLRENFDHVYLEEHVRICHFRNHYEVRSPRRWSETRRVWGGIFKSSVSFHEKQL